MKFWTTEDYFIQYSDYIRFSSNFQSWERDVKGKFIAIISF